MPNRVHTATPVRSVGPSRFAAIRSDRFRRLAFPFGRTVSGVDRYRGAQGRTEERPTPDGISDHRVLVDPKAVRLRRIAPLETERIAALNPVEGAEMWSTSLQSIVQLPAAHVKPATSSAMISRWPLTSSSPWPPAVPPCGPTLACSAPLRAPNAPYCSRRRPVPLRGPPRR
jgi:hypothetical protein